MGEPREWYLCAELSYPVNDFTLEQIKDEYADTLVAHVIEKSAYDQLKAERDELLKWNEQQRKYFDENIQLRAEVERLKASLAVAREQWELDKQFFIQRSDRLKALCDQMAEACESSIARSDDYGDSYCSAPIRKALAAYERAVKGE